MILQRCCWPTAVPILPGDVPIIADGLRENELVPHGGLAQAAEQRTLTSVMRLPRLPFVRALAALAIAFATPGLELGHGLAHHHAHEAEHGQPPSNHVDAGLHAEDGTPDHGHHTVSEALRIRADLSDFIASPNDFESDETATSLADRVLPVSGTKLFGDRATGPPPRLRAPPID